MVLKKKFIIYSCYADLGSNIGKKCIPFIIRTPSINFVVLMYLELTFEVPKIGNKKSSFVVTINQENYDQLVGHKPENSKSRIYIYIYTSQKYWIQLRNSLLDGFIIKLFEFGESQKNCLESVG